MILRPHRRKMRAFIAGSQMLFLKSVLQNVCFYILQHAFLLCVNRMGIRFAELGNGHEKP